MKKLHKLLLAIGSVLIASSMHAQQLIFPPEEELALTAQPVQSTQIRQQQLTAGYLGIAVDKVPASIRAHYPNEVVTKTQGLIVTRFADDSPAADDGIKLFDVLIAYDGQPIEKPEEFINKVRKDQPGRVAKFRLVRQGELLTVPVTIGKQKMAPMAQVPQMQQAVPFQGRQMPNMPAARGNTQPNANFDGLSIRKIGENIYDASIGFNAWDGTRQRRSFKGTREQILEQIMRARDLPPEARQQLLFAIKPRKKSSGWGGMPFGGGDMFDPGSFFKGWGF